MPFTSMYGNLKQLVFYSIDFLRPTSKPRRERNLHTVRQCSSRHRTKCTLAHCIWQRKPWISGQYDHPTRCSQVGFKEHRINSRDDVRGWKGWPSMQASGISATLFLHHVAEPRIN